jgi:hypothetical protein
MNLMNEDAIARLEAGLRAQRQQLSNAPRQASPSLSPTDTPPCDPIDIPHFLKWDVKSSPT